MSAGYSGTPLVKKLGIKAGYRIAILNAPENYAETLGTLPEDVTLMDWLGESLDFIHFFTKDRAELEQEFPALKAALAMDGMLWVSWPKRAAKVPTNMTEDVVREIALANGLVDVKIAAIDAVWSGLKLVYRVKDRK